MKRLLSVIAAVIFAAAPLGSLPVSAEIAHEIRTVTTEEELLALANEKGVLTDTFSFPAFNYDTVDETVTSRVLQDSMALLSRTDTWSTDAQQMRKTLENGVSYGIAAMTVLTHNGVIKPEEIQKSTANLHDTVLNDDVRYLIGRYAVTLGYPAMRNDVNAHVQMTKDEKRVREMVSVARSNETEGTGRYFLIGYQLSPEQTEMHAVTGLGLAAGSWTFDGHTYDQCIPVSDPAAAADGSAVSFAENACIFVDTKTYDYYIPAYQSGSETGGRILMTIDDDTVLSYRAPLHPVDSPQCFKDHQSVCVSTFADSAENLCATMVKHGTMSYGLLHDNNTVFTNGQKQSCYTEGTKFISTVAPLRAFNLAVISDQYIAGAAISRDNENAGDQDSIVEMTRDCISILNRSTETGNAEFRLKYNEVPYSDMMNDFWLKDCTINGNASIQLQAREDRLELAAADQNMITGTVILNAMNEAERAVNPSLSVKEQREEIVHVQRSKVVFKYNDETGELEMYIDRNNQGGACNTKLNKGDTNGDGTAFDLLDAQQVLRAYVNQLSQTNAPEERVNLGLSDIDNDRETTVADAQLILQEYVRRLAKVSE